MPLVNSDKDVNKLVPTEYPWALQHYNNGISNSWQPAEVSMADDIRVWKSDLLSEDEKRMILRSVGYFSTAESVVGNNLVLAIFKYITDGPCRQYLLRQAYEEANHNMALAYITESLGLPEDEVYNAYKDIKTIEDKNVSSLASTVDLSETGVDTKTVQGLQDFLENLVLFYVCMEGISFYSGFAMLFYMRKHNKMKGVAEIYEWIFTDEAIHCAFGTDLINGIISENPDVWTDQFKELIYARVEETVTFEKAYAEDTIPNGLLSLSAEQFGDYVEHMADRRLERINLKKLYNTKNPFPWMSEATDLPREQNFFEGRVTAYQSSANLEWD